MTLFDKSTTTISEINIMSKLMDYAFSTDALDDAYLDASAGVRFKSAVQKYYLNELKEINDFRESYYNGTYSISKGAEFIIHERGKERCVDANIFRDRVPIRSFCKNVLLKEFRKYLIYDNCSSLKGRGVDMQRDRLRVHLHKYYMQHHSNKGYILQMDLRKFFDNIDHETAIRLISDKIDDEEVINFLKLVFKSFEIDASAMSDEEIKEINYGIFNKIEYIKKYPKELRTGEKKIKKSINLGNEIAQFFGVFYPTRIDTYVKNVLGIKYYGRYCDDLYIIDESKEKLEYIIKEITKICNELKLHINTKKTRIKELSKKITFLKTNYILKQTGKIVMFLSKETFIRERRKLKKLKSKMEKGEISFTAIIDQYKSWRGTITRKKKIKGKKCKIARVYNNKHQLDKTDYIFKELFRSIA